LSIMLALTGCGAFFQCEGKTSCGTGSGGSTGTGDYVYVTYNVSGVNYIGGYTVGTNTLTALTDSPVQLEYAPVAMAVSANDDFLYVAAAPGTTYSGVWMYAISSTGVISGGTQENADLIGAMTLSPDGDWLYEIDSTTGSILSQYQLNKSTGALTAPAASFQTPGPGSLTLCGLSGATPNSQTCSIAVSPADNFVAVALNTGGTAVYPYTSTGGITSTAYTLIAPPTSSGDYSLAFDSSSYLYIASTAALSSYGGTNYTTRISNYTTYETNAFPRSVTLSTTYGYLFTANEGTSDIQEFTVSGGAVTALGTTPHVTGPTYVSALGVDRSGTYLLAAGYNTTNGLQMFTISSTGLAEVADQGTGTATTIPVVMALTH